MLWSVFPCFAFAPVSRSQASNSSNRYNLTTVLASQPQLNTFYAALTQIPWLFELAANANCTILAPSNDALAQYTGNQDLGALLSYHIIPGVYTLVDLQAGVEFLPTYLTDTQYANVTGGQRVGVFPTADGLSFESGLKARSNLNASNIVYGSTELGYATAVIHIIDKVLEIPIDEINTDKASISGAAGGPIIRTNRYRTRKAFGYGTELDFVSVHPIVFVRRTFWSIDVLIGSFHSFAPNTSNKSYIEQLTRNATLELIQYHFCQGFVNYSPDLTDGKRLQTLAGKDITITVGPNGTRYVKDVEILHPDYLISNGVVHVIDHPLNPNGTEARPAFALPSATPSSISKSRGLGTGAKAGIGVGVEIGALEVLVIAVFCLLRHRRRKNLKVPKSRSQGERQTLAAEMPGPEVHELHAPKSGQEWEVDGVNTQRIRVHEMQ